MDLFEVPLRESGDTCSFIYDRQAPRRRRSFAGGEESHILPPSSSVLLAFFFSTSSANTTLNVGKTQNIGKTRGQLNFSFRDSVQPFKLFVTSSKIVLCIFLELCYKFDFFFLFRIPRNINISWFVIIICM